MSKLPHISSHSPLLGLSSEKLEAFAIQEGEKAFRGRQIYEWIYHKGAKSLNSVTVLPKKWRDLLENKGIKIGRLDELNKVEEQLEDRFEKWLEKQEGVA